LPLFIVTFKNTKYILIYKEELSDITMLSGAAMTSNVGDLVGKTLGTCTLERLLGRGGMGAVYLARQARPARYVAVKVMLPQFAPNSEVYQEFLARFRREADVIARLEHINIMPIYEYGEQDGLAYLVMPYITGGNLRDVLAKRGKLSLAETIPYIDQTAAALDYAHAQGVIHRDLKPANFLLHADGRLVLADFGIARILDTGATIFQTLTSTGSVLGTPEYMAPEMARGESIDYRADIYELGIVLFQLLSGHAPFTGNTPYAVAIKHIQEPLPLLHPLDPSIPSEVDVVIQKATAKRREDRYSSARTLAQALQQASAAPAREQVEHEQKIPPPVLSSPSAVQAAPIQPEPILPQSAPRPVAEIAKAPAAYTPAPPQFYPNRQPTVPDTPYLPSSGKRPPWWIFIGILFVLVLFVGGVIIGLQINHTSSNTTPSSTRTVGTATAQSTTASAIPMGAQLYTASSPGQHCDTNGGTWTDYNEVNVVCLGGKARISNTAQYATLQGTFLAQLPANKTYPSNYVVQVQLQQEQSSHNDFGVYFRNQPGQQQGVYTFLVHPDGTWNVSVYDNTTGNPTRLTGGNLGIANTYTAVIVTIVVNGSQFTFYANNKLLGSIQDATYATGTAGIVVDQGASILASNFVLYATQ
jgi:serine/threonine-protein kinase